MLSRKKNVDGQLGHLLEQKIPAGAYFTFIILRSSIFSVILSFFFSTNIQINQVHAKDLRAEVSTCDSNDAFSILQLKKYTSEYEATRQFDCHHKLGESIENFIKKNELYFTLYNSTPINISDQDGQVTFSRFIYRIILSEKFTNTWNIHIIHKEGRLFKREIRLYYNGENFLERNLPFRFENFDDDDIRIAMEEIINGFHPQNVSAIEKFMSDVGAELEFVQEDGDVRRYSYSYKENPLTDLYSYIVWWPPKWLILFEFNRDNELLSFNITGRYGA